PVTGGVKTLVTPTRLVLQRLLAIGLKIRIPAFFIFTVVLIRPLLFEAAVRTSIFGPLIRTWMPFTALLCWVTWIVSAVLRPTNSCLGVTLLTATQYTGGGTNGAVTWTVAVAWLLAVFVSGRSPATVAVLVCGPAALGVVTSVM